MYGVDVKYCMGFWNGKLIKMCMIDLVVVFGEFVV